MKDNISSSSKKFYLVNYNFLKKDNIFARNKTILVYYDFVYDETIVRDKLACFLKSLSKDNFSLLEEYLSLENIIFFIFAPCDNYDVSYQETFKGNILNLLKKSKEICKEYSSIENDKKQLDNEIIFTKKMLLLAQEILEKEVNFFNEKWSLKGHEKLPSFFAIDPDEIRFLKNDSNFKNDYISDLKNIYVLSKDYRDLSKENNVLSEKIEQLTSKIRSLETMFFRLQKTVI